MVESDIRDDCEIRGRGIRCIQPATETDFKDNKLTTLGLEELMGHHRCDFKERWWVLETCLDSAYSFPEFDYLVLRDFASVDFETL